MSYRVHITADFETHDDAVKAMSDMEEVIGKEDGDLMSSEVEDLDQEV